MMIVIGFLLAVAGLSAAQYPYVPPLPGFQYPGMQYPAGFGQPGTQGFASRFGDGGNSVGTYAFSSPGTGPIGGTYSNQGGFTQSRFNDDDGGVVHTRFSGSPDGTQGSSSFVSSSNNGGQTYQQSSSSVTKDGLTTTYHTQG